MLAKLQNDILDQIQQLHGHIAECDELNSHLFSISELFNRFARPFDLWEICLKIIQISSFKDDKMLVNDIWGKIFSLYGSQKNFDLLIRKITELGRDLYYSKDAFPSGRFCVR